LHPFFVVFFFFKSTDLSHFNCCGCQIRPDLDVKKHANHVFVPCSVKISKNPLRMPPSPENHFTGPLLQQLTDETPCWHGAMKVVELASATHA